MRVFDTYLYEVQKGTKPVALITCDVNLCEKILTKLKKCNMPFAHYKVSENKVNIFFGAKNCIELIEKCLLKPLDKLDVYEDFILGIILGYDIKSQCKRFLERNKNLKEKSLSTL